MTSIDREPTVSPDLRNDVRRGFVWLGTASMIARVLELAKVFVVLWFLSKEQLGEATLAWSLTVVLEALNGLGLGQALLQAGELRARTVASAFWYTMAVASVLVVGVCLGAYPVARAYGHESLAPMVMLASTKLWFVGAALVPLTLLNRALAFERIAVVSTLATLVSGLVTCALAIAGFGAWAPLLGHTCHGLATMTLALSVRPYRPVLCFDWVGLREHASFGLKLAGSGLLHQVYRNMDYLLVAQWLDVSAVGVYRVAFDLAMAPCMAVLQVVNRAAVPVYARLQRDPVALARVFLWTLESLGFALAPVTALVALHAQPLLFVAKGGEWAAAAGIVPWLSAAALLRCLDQTFPQLFQALKKPWLALYESILAGVLIVGLLALMLHLFGSSQGAVAAGWAWLLAYPLLLTASIAMARHLLPISLGALLHSQRHTLGTMLAMTGTHMLVVAWVADRSPWAELAFGIPVSVATYLAYLYLVAGVRPGANFRPLSSAPAY